MDEQMIARAIAPFMVRGLEGCSAAYDYPLLPAKDKAGIDAAARAAHSVMSARLAELEEALEEARVTLNAIASWRNDSAAYTDRMDLPRRKMDEAQVIHIENEAKGPLRVIDAALAPHPKGTDQ